MRRHAQILADRLRQLGAISEDAGRLTRTFLSPAMARANRQVGHWMREAGLAARTLTLTIRYAGFETHTRAKTLAEPAQLDADIARHGLGERVSVLGAVPDGPHGFCHACFSGQYPTQPPSVASKMRLGGRA